MVSKHVEITLDSLNNDLEYYTRTIQLTPAQPLVTVGRSSKSLTKGLLPGADNAWFDSPVMSRNHAELFYEPDEEKVMLRDVGSMHGSRVNHTQIKNNIPYPLENDDLVTFGAPVTRAAKVFPPCSFRVNFEFHDTITSSHSEAQKGTKNSFEVPEATDDELDDHEELYENESEPSHPEASNLQRGYLSQSDEDSEPESVVEVKPMGSAPIDLTKDSSDECEVPDSIASPVCEDDAQRTSSATGTRVESPLVLDDSDDDDEPSVHPYPYLKRGDSAATFKRQATPLRPASVVDSSPASSSPYQDNKDIPVSKMRSTVSDEGKDEANRELEDESSESENDYTPEDYIYSANHKNGPPYASKASTYIRWERSPSEERMVSPERSSPECSSPEISDDESELEPAGEVDADEELDVDYPTSRESSDRGSPEPVEDEMDSTSPPPRLPPVSTVLMMGQDLQGLFKSHSPIVPVRPQVPSAVDHVHRFERMHQSWQDKTSQTPAYQSANPPYQPVIKRDMSSKATFFEARKANAETVNRNLAKSGPLNQWSSTYDYPPLRNATADWETLQGRGCDKSDRDELADVLSSPVYARHSGPSLFPFSGEASNSGLGSVLPPRPSYGAAKEAISQRANESTEKSDENVPAARYKLHPMVKAVNDAVAARKAAHDGPVLMSSPRALPPHGAAGETSSDKATESTEKSNEGEQEPKYVSFVETYDRLHKSVLEKSKETTRARPVARPLIYAGSPPMAALFDDAEIKEAPSSSPSVAEPFDNILSPVPPFRMARFSDVCSGVLADESTKMDVEETAPSAGSSRPSPSIRSMSISDIVHAESLESSHSSPEKGKGKRNFDEFSEMDEEEVKLESSQSVPEASEPVIRAPALPELQPSGTTGQTFVRNATEIPYERPAEQRPAKRLRRFASAMGYAALGGAAVGGALFSALVATAPDLL